MQRRDLGPGEDHNIQITGGTPLAQQAAPGFRPGVPRDRESEHAAVDVRQRPGQAVTDRLNGSPGGVECAENPVPHFLRPRYFVV
jgi:hypothetical protein